MEDMRPVAVHENARLVVGVVGVAGDVRALLDEAKDAIEDDAESGAGVTVSLV